MRFGLAGALLAAALALPFHAAIVLRIRRAEGQWGMLSITQMLAAAIFTPAMMFSLMALAAAAFRAGQRDPQITQALNDLFWLWFIGIVGTIVIQNITLAIASFTDRADPADVPALVRLPQPVGGDAVAPRLCGGGHERRATRLERRVLLSICPVSP